MRALQAVALLVAMLAGLILCQPVSSSVPAAFPQPAPAPSGGEL